MATSKSGGMSNKVTTVVATAGYGLDIMSEISYTDSKVIGNGSFGVVFQAKLVPSNELVAIKKVHQDRRFKNRELQIMRKLKHDNIVTLRYFFYSSGEKRDEVYLNLVMEYMPETLYKVERQYARAKQTLPVNYVRLYMYQLLRSMAFLHSLGFCHRDIKPQNMLLDAESGILKLCDFGSAKQLINGEPNVSYICSRYYRAPELIFGATDYSTKIDMWSAGCVLAELLLGQLIFPGESGVDQIVEIVKVMGTPTADQMHDMNPSYKQFKLPQLKPHPWPKVFRIRTPAEAIDLVSKLLVYSPSLRVSPMMGCAHPFFDELRQDPFQVLPNGRSLPPLFNFTDHERSIEPSVMPLLLPKATAQPDRDLGGSRLRNTAGEECLPKGNVVTPKLVSIKKPLSTGEAVAKQSEVSPLATTTHRRDLGNGDHVVHVPEDEASAESEAPDEHGADEVDVDDDDEDEDGDAAADDEDYSDQDDDNNNNNNDDDDDNDDDNDDDDNDDDDDDHDSNTVSDDEDESDDDENN